MADKLGQPVESERALRRAVAILDRLIAEEAEVAEYRKERSRCHNNLGIFLGKNNCLDEAVMAFEAALRDDPTDGVARSNLARARALRDKR